MYTGNTRRGQRRQFWEVQKKEMDTKIIQWLLNTGKPWTRYRTLVDLMGLPEDDPAVRAARLRMLTHSAVQTLINTAASWPGYPLKRHSDAAHPLYALSVLADFGLRVEDPGLEPVAAAVLAHQSPQGAFQTLEYISKAFGGTGEDQWLWMLCDAPTLLYALLALGLNEDPRVARAVQHLTGLVEDNGWHCTNAPELGNWKGPGRRADPCPIANLLALKALSLVPEAAQSEAVQRGVEMLLGHWEDQETRKYFLFGIGTQFRRLKYPLIWYDILHVVEVLSRYPVARKDPRLLEMLTELTSQAGPEGYYTAGSMYTAWKGWSFADKKEPSPWLTFLVLRIQWRFMSEPAPA